MFFFLQEVVKISKDWNNYLGSIPETHTQKTKSLAWKAAGGDRLEAFAHLNTVDMLVKAYPAYKHQDIELLSWQMVNNLLAYNKLYSYIMSKDNENSQIN